MLGWNESAWYSLFAGVALKSVAVLGAAWLMAALLRRRSAAARHLVWTAAFAALLLLPLLAVLLPPIPVPAAGGFLAAATATEGPAASTVPALAIPSQPYARAGAPPHSAPGHIRWRLWLLLLWGAGVAVGFAQMAAGWFAMSRIRRTAKPFAEPEFATLREELGIRHEIEVLETHRGSMPMTFGLLDSAVFLPADAAQWTGERRRLVLLHEMAHVQRGDPATHLLARIALQLYWWNPLAWTAWRQFLHARERAADDLVLNAGARASAYAGHLVEVARTLQSPRAGWAAIAMARPSQLEQRVGAILDSRIDRHTPQRTALWAAPLLAAMLIAPLAALRAQENQQTIPADADATIRAAAAQKNHDMLEDAAQAAAAFRKYDLARKLLDSSLAIRADANGAQSVEYGVGLVKLGDLERSRRNFTEANAFYTKAVSVLGSRPEAARPLVNLGTAALARKDSGQALDYFQRAQAADPAHAGVAMMWMALMAAQDHPQEAESLYRGALASEDPSSAEAATTMEVFAAFQEKHGATEEAGSLRDQAAAIRKALGARAPSIRQAVLSPAYHVGNGVAAPSVAYKVEPEYTDEARVAKYQGTAVIAVEIGPQGLAQNMRVVRSLGLGLDEKAVQAISQWTFKPGTKDGQPVTVAATIEVNFRLQ